MILGSFIYPPGEKVIVEGEVGDFGVKGWKRFEDVKWYSAVVY